MAHPVTGADCVALVSRGDAARLAGTTFDAEAPRLLLRRVYQGGEGARVVEEIDVNTLGTY